MLGSPQQLALGTMGIFLHHELTHLHILNKCTCARICKMLQFLREGTQPTTKISTPSEQKIIKVVQNIGASIPVQE